MHNNNLAMTTPPNGLSTTGNTTTLASNRNPQPSNAGFISVCMFNEMNRPLLQRLIELG